MGKVTVYDIIDDKKEFYTIFTKEEIKLGVGNIQVKSFQFYYLDPRLNHTQAVALYENTNGETGKKKILGSIVPFNPYEVQAAINGSQFADAFSMAIFQVSVSLTFGGIGSSQAFGSSWLGRAGAALLEDGLAQGVTTGFDYRKVNIMSFGGGLVSQVPKAGFVLKNLISAYGEYTIDGDFAFKQYEWTWRGAAANAAVGMAFDRGIDALKSPATLNVPKFSRLSNLSYKPKFATQFDKLTSAYERRVHANLLSNTIGAGAVGNAAANTVGEKVKN
jgi:hypothetical protein